MDSGLSILALKALDGLSARSVVTAQNIANAGTPGYRPLHLNFEAALAQAAAKGSEAVRQVVPQLGMDLAETSDGDLRLDLELATASATALRYAALIDILNRQMQIESLAVTGSM